MSERCFSCGGRFEPEPHGAVHPYMLSTPGCWAAFGRVLEREYSDPALFAASHRLSVDAYAIQHAGDPDEPRAVQSLWLHAASLWLVLREEAQPAFATSALKSLVGHTPRLRPEAPAQFSLTHEHILAEPPGHHEGCVRAWASAALDDWSDLHGEIERLAAKVRE